MTRTAQNNVQQMDDEVIRCYMNENTGREETTQAERKEVAERWCAGDYHHHRMIAAQHGLLPMALLIAALIDIDHPLLTSGRGVAYNSLQCSIIIAEAMLTEQKVAQPVQLYSINSPVERKS